MLKIKKSFDKSPNKPISPPNHYFSPELRVLEKLSTNGGWTQSPIRNINTVSWIKCFQLYLQIGDIKKYSIYKTFELNMLMPLNSSTNIFLYINIISYPFQIKYISIVSTLVIK